MPLRLARLRWYSAAVSGELRPRELARRLMKERFEAGSSSGFVLDEVTERRVAGRFVEKLEIEERVTGPLGDRYSSTRVVFRETRFRYSQDLPQFEFLDPPRSLAPFVATVLQLFDGQIAIAPVEVDVRKCLHSLERNGRRLTVSEMTVGGMLVDEDVLARVSFRASGDVRGAANEFLSNRQLRIERAKVTWTAKRYVVGFVLTPNGVGFDREHENDIWPILRPAVQAVLQSALYSNRPVR